MIERQFGPEGANVTMCGLSLGGGEPIEVFQKEIVPHAPQLLQNV